MRRNASTEIVYQASALAAATYYGKPIRCYDVDADDLFIGYKGIFPSANFVGSVAFVANAEDDGDYANWPLLALVASNLVSVAPAQITIATNTLAFATGLGTGTQRGLVRIPTPPPVIVPRFIYTSGGGAYDLTLKAVY